MGSRQWHQRSGLEERHCVSILFLIMFATSDIRNRYFMAANPSMERHLYSAHLPSASADLADFQPTMQVLTDTTKPGYYMTSFSPEAGYYMLVNVGPDVPWQKLVKIGEEGEFAPR
jgi:hypothetical protein